ncbi:unnamed protein product, partial [Sphenostylis stenocarpa]
QNHGSNRDFFYLGRRLFTHFLAVSSGRNLLSRTGMMETFAASISELRNVAKGNSNGGTVEMEGFKQRVDEIISKVDKASTIGENYYATLYHVPAVSSQLCQLLPSFAPYSSSYSINGLLSLFNIELFLRTLIHAPCTDAHPSHNSYAFEKEAIYGFSAARGMICRACKFWVVYSYMLSQLMVRILCNWCMAHELLISDTRRSFDLELAWTLKMQFHIECGL